MKKTTEFEYQLDSRTVVGVAVTFYVDLDNNEVVSTDRFKVVYLAIDDDITLDNVLLYEAADKVDNHLINLVEDYINTDTTQVYEVLDTLRGIEVDYKFYWSKLK
jgi:hypothetical protein